MAEVVQVSFKLGEGNPLREYLKGCPKPDAGHRDEFLPAYGRRATEMRKTFGVKKPT
jgi:hypothetical protein